MSDIVKTFSIYKDSPGLGTLIHDVNGNISIFGAYIKFIERELDSEKPDFKDIKRYLQTLRENNKVLQNNIDAYYTTLKDNYERNIKK